MKHNTIICMHTAKICIIWKKIHRMNMVIITFFWNICNKTWGSSSCLLLQDCLLQTPVNFVVTFYQK